MRSTLLAVAVMTATFLLSPARADDRYGKKQEKGEAAAHEKHTEKPSPMPGAKPQKRTNGLGLSATLVDADQKAKEKTATVLVKVSGVRLVDPADAKEQSKNGQGHLHYQVDNGLVIATTTTKLSFHGLSSGNHKITVMLAANDHDPLGPEKTLEVRVP